MVADALKSSWELLSAITSRSSIISRHLTDFDEAHNTTAVGAEFESLNVAKSINSCRTES
ncbi:hypothetical protein ACHAXS_003906 [Conticribra weissflogii]